jgi:hypothetical protein
LTLILTFSLREKELALCQDEGFKVERRRGSLSLRERAGVRVPRGDRDYRLSITSRSTSTITKKKKRCAWTDPNFMLP